MDNKTRIERLKEKDYQELFGVKKPVFDKMLAILEEQNTKEHYQGGRPLKLSVLDKLIITLCYLREYRTMTHIGFDYNVSKSTICYSIRWVENTLAQYPDFQLPAKKEGLTLDGVEVV